MWAECSNYRARCEAGRGELELRTLVTASHQLSDFGRHMRWPDYFEVRDAIGRLHND